MTGHQGLRTYLSRCCWDLGLTEQWGQGKAVSPRLRRNSTFNIDTSAKQTCGCTSCAPSGRHSKPQRIHTGYKWKEEELPQSAPALCAFAGQPGNRHAAEELRGSLDLIVGAVCAQFTSVLPSQNTTFTLRLAVFHLLFIFLNWS